MWVIPPGWGTICDGVICYIRKCTIYMYYPWLWLLINIVVISYWRWRDWFHSDLKNNCECTLIIIDGTFTDVTIDTVTNRAPTWWNDPCTCTCIHVHGCVFNLTDNKWCTQMPYTCTCSASKVYNLQLQPKVSWRLNHQKYILRTESYPQCQHHHIFGNIPRLSKSILTTNQNGYWWSIYY